MTYIHVHEVKLYKLTMLFYNKWFNKLDALLLRNSVDSWFFHLNFIKILTGRKFKPNNIAFVVFYNQEDQYL